MSARRLLAAVLCLALSWPARAQSPTKEAYNAVAQPLDDLSKELLAETGYHMREDGKYWDQLTEQPIRKDEMQYLLSRLAGARRLKALLELNLILNRSDGEKKLSASERETVREIVRKHWPVFGVGTRRDFRAHFSVEELTHLDKIPPRFDRGSALLMRDPDPVTAEAKPAVSVEMPAGPAVPSTAIPADAYVRSVWPAKPPEQAPQTEAQAAPDAPAPVADAVAEPPRPFPRGVLTPFMEPPSLRRPSPFAPRRQAPAVVATPPAERPPLPVAAAPSPVYREVQAPASIPAPAGTAPAVAAVLAALAPMPPASQTPMIFADPASPRPQVEPSPAPYRAPALATVQARVAPPDSSPAPIATPAPPPPAASAAPALAAVAARVPGSVVPAPVPPAATPSTPVVAPPPVENPSLGVLQAWVPPGAEAAAAPNAAASPQSAAALTPTPPLPPALPPIAAPKRPERPAPADATQAEFDEFVAAGPYGREARELLKLLAAKAPEFCRALLRRTVVRGTPLIVHDGSRAGFDRRAGFVPAPAGTPAIIALAAGPVLVERKRGLFSKSLVALPEDPKAWGELGVAVPTVDALNKDAAPTGQENGAWGATKRYRDRSMRGEYSHEQQAGELLERLLILGLEREGYASSTYAARAWARSARLLFSARLAEERGNDSFLDPDRRVELRDWITRGDEADDILIGSWSSARGNILDPRRGGPDSQAQYERAGRESCPRALLADHLAEAARAFAARARAIEALLDADLISSAAARSSAEKAAADEAAARKSLLASPPKCERGFGADENGLRRSAALLAEASRAERAFREKKAQGGKNAD